MFHLNLVPEVHAEGKTLKFLGIYSKNREEWIMSELAGISQGVTTVPLYDTLGPDAAEFVINQTELATIACAGSYVPSLLMLKKAGRIPTLKNLIIFDKIDNLECGAECDLKIYEFQELIKMETGISAEQMPTKPLADDIYMLCYTSGTTGDPKAAKLTHKNLLSVATSANYAGVVFEHTDTVISYLPLAHSFEKVLFALCLVKGVRIGYYSGNVLKITDDCAVLQPTLFPSVPRLYNRIFDKINARLEELTGVRSYLANRAVNSKLYYLKE
jgi:long-chain acyl-CoA synthetase